MTLYQYIIKARIHLFSTENGGKTNMIISGYRPNFLFAENINYDGSILFDKKEIQPGEKAYVSIRLFASQPIIVPDIHAAFVFREGAKVVGNGALYEKKTSHIQTGINCLICVTGCHCYYLWQKLPSF